MKRGEIGRYETTHIAGEESVSAFVPHPLPPDPPVVLDASLQQAMDAAETAIANLNQAFETSTDQQSLRDHLVRQEAIASSQIEGIRVSLDDLERHETGEQRNTELDDVAEVLNCASALEHGLRRMGDGFPLSKRLIREAHAILMSGKRGISKQPGEFRTSQNWIGGTRPGYARFVPPPPQAVPDCMSALEQFVHAESDNTPALVRTALTHLQFETIHPFLDGNGRTGRILVIFQLCQAGVVRAPILPLSTHFKQHQSTYFSLLSHVRQTGDWEAWLQFFFEGVRESAEAGFKICSSPSQAAIPTSERSEQNE